MAESVLLQSCFQLLPNKKYYEVRLTRKKLVYQRTSIDSCCTANIPLFSVRVDDIYGAKVFRSKMENDNSAYLHIYTCPVKGKRRVRRRIRFKIDGWENSESNSRGAEEWVKMIVWLVKDPNVDVSTLKDKNLPACRKLLVLVNPSSGPGKSLKIFEHDVAPMFTEASIEYTLHVTEYAGHAEKIALELNVEDWDGIVICSGDGLVYEFINGLMNRSDWNKAICMPLGVIPTGSGNALCFSALYACGEPFGTTAAIFSVICGQTLDLDLCTIETPNKKLYAFLSLTWGIISDVDIESEKYRYLGNARFTVGALIRILGLRVYRGRLSYLPASDNLPQVTGNIEIPTEQTPSQNNDRSSFDSFPNSPSGTFFQIQYAPTENVASHDNVGMVNSEHPSINEVASSDQGPPTSLLTPLKKPVPSNWKTVEGEFIMGCSALLSHLGPDIIAAPHCKFGDGILHIIYLQSGVSRLRLLALFGEMETGVHVDSEECVYIRAQAFRLEPDLTQPGTIAVDGERIPYSAVQGEIHKGLGRIMCSKPYNKL